MPLTTPAWPFDVSVCFLVEFAGRVIEHDEWGNDRFEHPQKNVPPYLDGFKTTPGCSPTLGIT
jgi:hypothetical protein